MRLFSLLIGVFKTEAGPKILGVLVAKDLHLQRDFLSVFFFPLGESCLGSLAL